ncbi:tyrosine-tRNA ligase [Kwoniella shandongensis]|uniref:Tyrosine--tRNA ligase n=1 Tax=Kwoniella shandongensis TaxID=1734106 RepID=A0A5M6BYI9_9TREE|nr:tyrosine-tRNA ligase [Kwoniella shandongensis]KAA5527884.1 tyrosine-tRNA ligase [Kwoniella shandongensis]
MPLLPFQTLFRARSVSCRSLRVIRRGIYDASEGKGKGKGKNVIDELEQRGFVAALTSPKLRIHVQSPTTIYAGVDPSASSLHVGNLLPLLGLLHFQAKGHQSICLIGGATGSIGDPSGRSTERKSLSSDELAHNVSGITSQVHRFFSRGEAYLSQRGIVPSHQKEEKTVGMGVKVLDNYDWTKGVSLLDFLRTVGKAARVSVMLSRDSVKNRLSSDSGISYTEFTYQLLQAFDFSHLYDSHNCRIQLGGSDQWGNIVAGIDLIKRLKGQGQGQEEVKANEEQDGLRDEEDDTAFGLTIPLLTTSTGEKFGKSAGNAVWLDERRTSAAEFYQFFLRTTDEDVEKYLKLFTFLPLEEINSVMRDHQSAKSERDPQKLLAREVTELVHGPEALSRALTAAQVLYSTNANSLKSADVLAAFEGDNRFHRVSYDQLDNIGIAKLAVQFGLCTSRGEANRLISNSAMGLNERRISDPKETVKQSDLIDGHIIILRVGTKRQAILYVD